MLKNLFTKMVGSDSDKALARLSSMIERCNALEPEMMKLTDAELQKLNRLLQELAWDAVRQHPLSGIKPPPQLQ